MILARKFFDLDNVATRQDYAFIVSRMFDILKVRGIEFKVWEFSNDGQRNTIEFKGLGKSLASSTTRAKGTGNGSGTSRNIDGDDSIDFYRDYKDLAGIYEKAYVFALGIGVIETKFFDDIIVKNFDKNFEPRKIIKYIDGEPVLVDVEKFLAPNDPITYGDIFEGLMPLLDKFIPTDYANFVRIMMFAPPVVATPPAVPAVEPVDGDEDADVDEDDEDGDE